MVYVRAAPSEGPRKGIRVAGGGARIAGKSQRYEPYPAELTKLWHGTYAFTTDKHPNLRPKKADVSICLEVPRSQAYLAIASIIARAFSATSRSPLKASISIASSKLTHLASSIS